MINKWKKRVIFDLDILYPMKEWTVFNADKTISMNFKPYYEMKVAINLGLLKSNFCQIPGEFSGYFIKPDGGKFVFSGIKGFSETQRTRC